MFHLKMLTQWAKTQRYFIKDISAFGRRLIGKDSEIFHPRCLTLCHIFRDISSNDVFTQDVSPFGRRLRNINPKMSHLLGKDSEIFHPKMSHPLGIDSEIFYPKMSHPLAKTQ